MSSERTRPWVMSSEQREALDLVLGADYEALVGHIEWLVNGNIEHVTAVNDYSALVEKMRALAAEFDERSKKLRNDSAYTDCAVTFEYCRDELRRALGDDGK